MGTPGEVHSSLVSVISVRTVRCLLRALQLFFISALNTLVAFTSLPSELRIICTQYWHFVVFSYVKFENEVSDGTNTVAMLVSVVL